MNLSQIELLHVLQDTNLNLSKAAEKMHLGQSAVSRQLSLFEAGLGSPLFERQGKKLIGMTTLGLRIMEEVAIINRAKTNIQHIAAIILTVIKVFCTSPPPTPKSSIFCRCRFNGSEKNIRASKFICSNHRLTN